MTSPLNIISRGFFGFILLGLASSVIAQTGNSTVQTTISMNDFVAMIQAMKSAARIMAPYLIDEGYGLLGIFFGISAFVLLVKLFLGPGDPSVKANIFLHCVKGVLVAGMLASWMNYGTGSFGENVTPIGNTSSNLAGYKLRVSVEDVMVNSFDGLVNGMFDRFAGGGGKEKLFSVVGQSWSMLWSASDKRDQIRDQARQGMNPLNRLVAWFEQIGDKFITLVVAVIVGGLALLLMAVYLFVIYFGDILAFLGMFMGPIMIPGLVFSPLQWLFDSWLKAMISAGFFKLIASWLALITMKTVELIQNIANKMYEATYNSTSATDVVINMVAFDAGFILSIVMTIVYLVFAILLMWQCWRLTEMMMKGSFMQGGMALQSATSSIVKK